MKTKVWVLILLSASSVFAQTESLPSSLVPVDPARQPGLGLSVPARQLLIPSRAVKEIERAQAAFASGDIHSSAGHLEKALRIYPACLEAHNALGSRYISLREYEKAAAEFQRAIDIDPRVLPPVSNLSVALFLLGRYPQAEAAARRALELDSSNKTARYMLGAILATEGRNPMEAANLLRQTRSDFSDARLLLAKIWSSAGNLEEAKTELREYLKSPDPAKKQNVERWLARLSQAPGTDRAQERQAP